MKPLLSLVTPVYNEQDSIENTIKELIFELKKLKIDFELITVDNGSQDFSGKKLENLAKLFKEIKVISVFPNQGYGGGVITGLEKARGDIIGFLWSDGQVKAKDVVRVYENLLSQNLDLCKARRVKRYDGLARRVVTIFYRLIFNLVFKTHFADINGCPKIFKKEALLKINPQARDLFLDAEVMLKASRYNLKIGEVPVTLYPRSGGKSSIGIRSIFEFLKNIIIYRIIKQKHE